MPAGDGVIELVPLPAVATREREVQSALRDDDNQQRPHSHNRQRATLQPPRAGPLDRCNVVHPTSVKQPDGTVKIDAMNVCVRPTGFTPRKPVRFINSIPVQIRWIGSRDRVFEPYVASP
jgi:hypothetical protein